MQITFDKKNYRKHSEQNKKRIRKSLTESGTGIFGCGYLISDRLVELREKAEREKAEREKAIVWKLSERELGIIASLSVERKDDERKV